MRLTIFPSNFMFPHEVKEVTKGTFGVLYHVFDVKQHKVFPTIINEFEFDMDKQECDLVIDELNDMEKYKENNLIIKPQMNYLDIYQIYKKNL